MCRRGWPQGQRRAGPLFFERVGLGLEGVGDGQAEQLAALAEGDLLAVGQDGAIGCGVGGSLDLPGVIQGALDDEALEGGLGYDRLGGHHVIPSSVSWGTVML